MTELKHNPGESKKIKEIREAIHKLGYKIYYRKPETSGIGFEYERMDKFLKNEPGAQKYFFWIVYNFEKNNLLCRLVLHPRNEPDNIVKIMDFILKHFGKTPVTEKRGDKVAFETPARNIIHSVEDVVTKLVEESMGQINICLDKLKKTI